MEGEVDLEVIAPNRVVVVPDAVIEARETLRMVLDLIARSDLKAGALGTALVASLGALGVSIRRLTAHHIHSPVSHAVRTSVVVLLSLSGAMLVFAVVLATMAVYPMLGSQPMDRWDKDLRVGDLAFFGRLRGMGSQQIADEITQASNEGRLIVHIAEQIAINSEIAWSKLRCLQWSVRGFGVGGGLTLIGAIIWLSRAR